MTKTTNTSLQDGMGSEALTQMIRPDPLLPGPARWRLAEFNIPVWAVIQHIGDLANATAAPTAIVAQTAADYAISEDAVRAALAYYGDNSTAIDTLIANNAIATSE